MFFVSSRKEKDDDAQFFGTAVPALDWIPSCFD